VKKLLPLAVLVSFFVYFAGTSLGFSPLTVLLLGCVPVFLAGFGWLWWFRRIYFFRDPPRVIPSGDDVIVSPADGRVMYVYEVRAGEVVSDKQGRRIPIGELAKTELRDVAGWLIGIYMTPFDVHYTRTPVGGSITTLHYHRTDANLPMVDLWEYVNFTLLRRAVNMFAAPFHLENERMTIEVRNDSISCFIILIADRFVNKITTFFEQGQRVTTGQKICFIERGSQTDLFIAASGPVTLKVKPGDQVYAGTSILGRIARAPSPVRTVAAQCNV
jgi:phosphatidylserine decarboxylase